MKKKIKFEGTLLANDISFKVPKITHIYDEPMSLKEFFQIIIFIGIPFSLAFALIYTFLISPLFR